MGWLKDYSQKISKRIITKIFIICLMFTPRIMLGFLFKLGLSVDAKIGDYTLLQIACKNKRKRLTRYLIQKGADLEKKSRLGKSAIEIILDGEDIELLEMLLGHKGHKENVKIIFAILANTKDVEIITRVLEKAKKLNIDYEKEDLSNKKIIRLIMKEIFLKDEAVIFGLLRETFKINVDTFEFFSSEILPIYNKFDVFNNGMIKNITKKFVQERKTLFSKLIDMSVLLDKKNIFSYLYNLGAEFNIYDNSNLLTCAILNKDIEMINIMLDKNPGVVNLADVTGNTPIMVAAISGNLEIVELLIKKGADVKTINTKGESALFGVCKKELEVNAILRKYEKLQSSQKAKSKKNKLNETVNESKINKLNEYKIIYQTIKEELVGNGASLDYVDKFGRKAIDYICCTNNVAMAKVLIRLKGTENIGGINQLMYCVRNKSKDMLKFLLNLQVININEKDANGKTILIHAIEDYSSDNIIKMLLSEKDIDINAKDAEGKTALMYAFETHCNEDIIKLLLSEKDIDINAKDNEGKTALMYAFETHCNEDIIKLLLSEKDIDINEKDANGKTVLMYAFKTHCNEDIIKMLLSEKDIDINEKDTEGKTALIYALESNLSENIINLLFSIEDIKFNIGEISYYRYKYKIIEQYLNKNKSGVINRKNEPKYKKINEDNQQSIINKNLLIKMVQQQNYNEVKRLLGALDIDLHVKDNFGNEAVHYAVDSGNLEILKLFIEQANIDINIKDGSGKSLLMCAIKNMKKVSINEKEKFLQLTEYLIQKDIGLEDKDYFNKTALEYLKEYKEVESEKLKEIEKLNKFRKTREITELNKNMEKTNEVIEGMQKDEINKKVKNLERKTKEVIEEIKKADKEIMIICNEIKRLDKLEQMMINRTYGKENEPTML